MSSKVISSTPELYVNAEQRQNSLQDSRDADQHHQQLEQLRQATVSGKLVYRPKTDGADDNDNQNTNQSRKHRAPLCRDSALHHDKSIARGSLHAKGFPGWGNGIHPHQWNQPASVGIEKRWALARVDVMHLGYVRPFSFQIGRRPEMKVSSIRHGVTEITLSDGRLVRATLHVKSVKADPKKPGAIDVSYNVVAEIMATPETPIFDVHETIQ